MNHNTFPKTISDSQPLSLFRKVFFRGEIRRLWAKLTRRRFCLRDLNETLEHCPIVSSHYAGIKTVNIAKILGTQGKADEFDREFHPTQERSRSRWMNIALQIASGHVLPPVELIQVNDMYYVRDGHHRISVSRAVGQDFIDAEVTILRLSE